MKINDIINDDEAALIKEAIDPDPKENIRI